VGLLIGTDVAPLIEMDDYREGQPAHSNATGVNANIGQAQNSLVRARVVKGQTRLAAAASYAALKNVRPDSVQEVPDTVAGAGDVGATTRPGELSAVPPVPHTSCGLGFGADPGSSNRARASVRLPAEFDWSHRC
jgi:hypothetical protein